MAQRASFEAIRGTFNDGVISAHLVWVVGGSSGVPTTIVLEGQDVRVNDKGWPRVDAGAVGQTTASDLGEQHPGQPHLEEDRAVDLVERLTPEKLEQRDLARTERGTERHHDREQAGQTE